MLVSIGTVGGELSMLSASKRNVVLASRVNAREKFQISITINCVDGVKASIFISSWKIDKSDLAILYISFNSFILCVDSKIYIILSDRF